jgi:hypothetical protein
MKILLGDFNAKVRKQGVPVSWHKPLADILAKSYALFIKLSF